MNKNVYVCMYVSIYVCMYVYMNDLDIVEKTKIQICEAAKREKKELWEIIEQKVRWIITTYIFSQIEQKGKLCKDVYACIY